MSREEQFDGMLMEMVQQHGDSFSDLFGTVFSFLARRTNFYTDGDEDHVEKLVINQLTKCRNTAMIENNEAECDPLIIKLKHEFEQAFPAELDEENTESISKEDEKIKSLENFHLITEALIHTKKAERAQRKKYRLLGRLIKERPIDSKRNTAIDADMPTSQHQELSSLLLSTDKQEGNKKAKRYSLNREMKHAAKKEKKRQEEKERAAKNAIDNDDDSRIVELTDEQADASQEEIKEKTKLELIKACIHDDVAKVEELLAAGHDVNETTKEGLSLLAVACENGSSQVVQLLLKRNASIEDRGIDGNFTPLIRASSYGHIDVVNILLQHGALVDAKSSSLSSTSLIYAVAAQHKEVVKALLQNGADVTASNARGHTPTLIANHYKRNDILEILLQYSKITSTN